MVMLKDELWLQVCDDDKDFICDVCIEKRLGREIGLEDLKRHGHRYAHCTALWWNNKTGEVLPC